MNDASNPTVFTIGHSTLSYTHFRDRLVANEITAIADVRTAPYSRHFPHFNKESLQRALREDGISYVFLGSELGGRPNAASLYKNGVADYEAMAGRQDFKAGIDRVIEGARKYRVALMCSEQHPLDCHRCLLVGRALTQGSVPVCHVLANGRVATQKELEDELLRMARRAGDDLFAAEGERLDAAYRDRARKVAYTISEDRGQDGAIRSNKVG